MNYHLIFYRFKIFKRMTEFLLSRNSGTLTPDNHKDLIFGKLNRMILIKIFFAFINYNSYVSNL